MESLRRVFLEDPLGVYAVLAFAELVIAGLWYRGRTKRLAFALLAPLLLAAGVFALDAAVQTDREQLECILKEIAHDIESGDFTRAAEYLADDFYGDYVSKAAAVEAGRQAKQAYGIRTIRVTAAELEVHDSVARVLARTTVWYDHPTYGSGRQTLAWTVHWGKRHGQWKVINVERARHGGGL
ncbi:MAG TPA: hypothetical protein VNA25_02625 [Phycisphaerae bacterium]|nr:hypothetical protein [Phycisphaerae bacterium]